MALGSHLITVRRLKKYIDDVIGKKANLPDTSKTIIGNISQINSNKQNKTDNALTTTAKTVVGAINEINSDLTNNTCANLLNPTAQTQTKSGVTFTNNGDGTYTVNGTAQGDYCVCYLTGGNMTIGDMELDATKTYKLLGSQSGSGSTYQIVAKGWKTDGTVSWFQDWKNFIITGVVRCTIYIAISNGYTANNLLFKPMLTTDLNATYDDYVPYTGDSGRLNEDVAEIYDNVLDTSDIASTLAVDYAKSVSHIGMIIQSTTLDTEAKVKAIYGGTSWSLIQGRMLLGASTSHAVNSTGGSETHTLAVENLPSHSHGLNNHTHSIPALSGYTGNDGTHSHEIATQDGIWFASHPGNLGGTQTNSVAVGYGAGGRLYASAAGSHTHTVTTNASTTGGNSDSTTATGNGTAFNTMPPYKAVYIWERTA
jgi:hypothetical protein